MMQLILTNTIHNTAIQIRVPDEAIDHKWSAITLSEKRHCRYANLLCGMDDCCCWSRHWRAEDAEGNRYGIAP